MCLPVTSKYRGLDLVGQGDLSSLMFLCMTVEILIEGITLVYLNRLSVITCVIFTVRIV